jgi:acetyl-CoA synthetase
VVDQPFTTVLDESKAPLLQMVRRRRTQRSRPTAWTGTSARRSENKTAIVFEADDGAVTGQLQGNAGARPAQFANALKALGVKKGDRVIIYMPMSVEGVVAMQACARIGAVHSVVFGGFSANSLQERIIDAGAVAVITPTSRCAAARNCR